MSRLSSQPAFVFCLDKDREVGRAHVHLCRTMESSAGAAAAGAPTSADKPLGVEGYRKFFADGLSQRFASPETKPYPVLALNAAIIEASGVQRMTCVR